jgi:hypothetical protein
VAQPACRATTGRARHLRARFSNLALASVIVLFGTGVGASILHLPTLASLWQTSYGQAIIVKASLLGCAILVASGNLLRTVPALSSPVPPISAAILLRRLVSVEVLLVAAAIAAAAVLSSLPPPPKELASIGGASAHTGPGPVTQVVSKNGYQLEFHVTPNRAAAPNEFAVRIDRGGRPVTGVDVTATVSMLDMEMQAQSYKLSERPQACTRIRRPRLMVGHWGLPPQRRGRAAHRSPSSSSTRRTDEASVARAQRAGRVRVRRHGTCGRRSRERLPARNTGVSSVRHEGARGEAAGARLDRPRREQVRLRDPRRPDRKRVRPGAVTPLWRKPRPHAQPRGRIQFIYKRRCWS